MIQDLGNTTLGTGFHFQHRNPRALPIESFAHDSGRTLSEGISKHEQLKKKSAATARLSAHPNGLAVNVMELPDNWRLQRHLPTRFLV
jgi:hypothetical protein